MRSYTVIAGDDEEFALSIIDPATNALVDLTVDIGWALVVTLRGRKTSLVKSFTNAQLVINDGHPDPAVADLSIKLTLTAAETAALPVGEYLVSAHVEDSGGLRTTILREETTIIIQKTP